VLLAAEKCKAGFLKRRRIAELTTCMLTGSVRCESLVGVFLLDQAKMELEFIA